MNIAVKDKIARSIGEHFSTVSISNTFCDFGVLINTELFAKWRITLDAFGKLPNPETNIIKILETFCHPLNFQDKQIRLIFIEEINEALKYEDLQIEDIQGRAVIYSSKDGSALPAIYDIPKNSTDYIYEALTFFKNEYNKLKIPGVTYEYYIGELMPIGDIIDKDIYYEDRLKSIERLKDAGIVTQYKVEEMVNDNGIWSIAMCKIDENKLTGKDVITATEANVQELIHKIEITGMPEVSIKGFEDRVVLQKPKDKVIQLRKFPAGLRWEEITMQFLNGQEVIITAKNETHQTTYEAMGFQDNKKMMPDKQWQLLQLLTLKNGELSWKNNNTLELKDINKIKKQKQVLSDCLKAYFQIKDDPFHDYKTDKSYRIKLNLLPEQT
jgi:hypothetical protein